MKDSKKCPICGCEEIGVGRQCAQGSMFPEKGLFGSQVIAEICTKCGNILSMRVKNPEKFKL